MNGAVLWHIYGDAGFDFAKGTVFGVVRIKYNGAAGAWNALNSMGAADVDGDKNLYVESSYFCGLGSTDWDDNARGVFRHNVLDNASAMSHGADTSYIGGMHVEYYDNLCIFDNLGDDTINAQCFFESRGGTGIIADNTIPDIASSAWGNKPEIKLQIQVLDRNAGLFGLWGQGVAGAQYPAPRQVGMGHANSGYTNHSVTFAHPNADLASGLDNNSPPIYLGDLCPWYQWGNTGGGNLAAPGIMMSGYNQGTPDDPADYIQVGRDWINGVKPGYAKYTWPHPLRNDALPPLPEGPGLAAAYPTDAGIAGHADVIFADDFESYGAASELTTHWDEAYHLQNTRIATESNKVFAGSKALEFSVPVQTSETSNTAIKHLDPTEDVLFLRCYTKFDPGFLTYSSSHNGLGIQANYSGPGIPADGTNKFYVGLENSGTSEPPPGPTHLYVYHPEQRDIWGDHWYPDGRVVPFDYLPGDYGPDFVPRPNFTPERDRWYCIELMVKANTPGERDGRVAYWIDGNLAADFPNIRLRDVDTLKIDKFHIGLHINGATTRVNTKWYDNVVAARSYIGPMAGGTPDETPPTVALSAPAGGATVSNTVTVSATASDNVGVVGVQFRLDGANLGAEDTSAPYSIAWNT
ncbi:MAG: hypothetical protein JXR37_26470, partial [Kiritimatiellae bacterium]|nr:hypothetical protein [Kiritimatiellia bacterium]